MGSDGALPKVPDSKPGSKPDEKDDLKSLPLAEVEKRLGYSPDGLSQVEAQKRLAHYGPNEIEEKKANPLLKFLTYFWGPIPWMIEAAVILSGVLRHWPDFFIILVLLVANGVVGFWEEHQAGKAIDALKAELAIKARTIRDGKWIMPPSRELVPGDVIRLRLGDIVPADARLLDGDPVEVDQSALTGESLPATRKSGEAVFSASIIRQGEIGALVYATGANTYFGKTAALVQEVQTVSHFQQRGTEDRHVPHHPRCVTGERDHHRLHHPGQPDPHHVAVRPGAHRGRDPRGDADGAVGHDGGRRASPREEKGHREPVGGDRGVGRRGRALHGQDRHVDREQTDARRALQR